MGRTTCTLAFLAVTIANSRSAQEPVRIAGTVRGPGERPVGGVNVFIVETLDGALTDSTGAFVIRVHAAPSYTLVARAIGWTSFQRTLNADSLGAPVTITLAPVPTELNAVRIEAGSYRIDNTQGATLSTLDVVTTPGSTADVYRAIQLLPGVLSVDEGTGLYVRGGDFTETRVFLNDAALVNPAQLQTPTGTFVGRIDPFQLDGIYFSSGGFGARYGNALSGVADLRTLGMPDTRERTISLGIGHASLGGAWLPTAHTGFRVAANASDLREFFRLNGATFSYRPAPRSLDGSASGVWRYRDSGEVRVFAIASSSSLGITLDQTDFSGLYHTGDRSRLAIVSWHDQFRTIRFTGSASLGRETITEDYGTYRLDRTLNEAQGFLLADVALSDGLRWRTGVEVERSGARIAGSLPQTRDTHTGRTTVFADDSAGTRSGTFTELDIRASDRLRVTAGVRGDYATLTNQTSIDPRLSAAFGVTHGVTLTAAAGVYHQLPDAILYVDSVGGQRWPSMRATQVVAGAQAGNDASSIRLEVYDKRYTDLVALDQNFTARGDGRGRAYGADLFMKLTGPLGLSVRGIVSAARSHRTDPTSGEMRPAPFDIPRSVGLVLDWKHNGLDVALGQRMASGKPFTPSERLPDFRRLDLSVSNVWRTAGGSTIVAYASLMNLLNRTNVQGYYYSADHTTRLTTPGIFNRSVYFGAMLERQ